MPPPSPTPDPEPSSGPSAQLAQGPAAGGTGIIRASWVGTALLTITAVPTAIAPGAFVALWVGVTMVLFFAGIGIFAWAYAVAVNRSRRDEIGLTGLFFLSGTAPKSVQRSMLGSFGVEVAVGVATAAVHVYTPLAFGVLAPMYGLALCGLWAAKWGTFPLRVDEPRRKKSTGATSGSGQRGSTGKKGSAKQGAASAKGSAAKGRGRGGSGRVTPKASQGGRSGSRTT